MAQILVQVSDRMLRDLEQVAPGSSRTRSRFIQLALQRALMEVQDRATRDAYRRVPDDASDWFDPRVWDEWSPRPARRRQAKKPRGKR
jgi:hypothetical protein